MRCPFCGNIDTQVKDSRPAEDHVSIRRRRFCSACGGRFTTYERVQLRDLVVIKSNGRREDFEREKLTLHSHRAPKRPAGIRTHGTDDFWDCAASESIETDIQSKMIGEIVMEALARIDTVAYVRFASAKNRKRRMISTNSFRNCVPKQQKKNSRCPTNGSWRTRLPLGGVLGRVWPNPAAMRDCSRRSNCWARVYAAGRAPPCRNNGIGAGGDAARGAMVYVTLEPCSHHGQPRLVRRPSLMRVSHMWLGPSRTVIRV